MAYVLVLPILHTDIPVPAPSGHVDVSDEVHFRKYVEGARRIWEFHRHRGNYVMLVTFPDRARAQRLAEAADRADAAFSRVGLGEGSLLLPGIETRAMAMLASGLQRHRLGPVEEIGGFQFHTIPDPEEVPLPANRPVLAVENTLTLRLSRWSDQRRWSLRAVFQVVTYGRTPVVNAIVYGLLHRRESAARVGGVGVVVGAPAATVQIEGRDYPLDPAGQSRAPAYGAPPGAAMSQGQRCGGCRYFVSDPSNPLQGYCKLFRFIAEATKWCAAWEA